MMEQAQASQRYLNVEPCVKCGSKEPTIRWEKQAESYSFTKGITYIGGSMIATCERCNYKWTVLTLDEVPF